MVSKDELLWFGRAPTVSQLGDSDAGIADNVRGRKHVAYERLDTLAADMKTFIAQCSSGFSPADRQISLLRLKNAAAMHIETEVVSIIKTYDGHVAAVLQNTKVLISTLDAANKLFANLLVGPAKALRNTCKISLAVLDEGQRFETLPAAAILSHTQTAVVIADTHQRIESDRTYSNRNPWVGEGDTIHESIRNPDAQWATELLLDPNANMAQCLKLTQCKRCGPNITGFCRRLFPSFLRASGPTVLHPRPCCGSIFTRATAGILDGH